MIISFAWAKRCARCRRRVARADKSYVSIALLDGRFRVAVRVRFCSDCFGELAEWVQRVREEHPDTTRFSRNVEGLG